MLRLKTNWPLLTIAGLLITMVLSTSAMTAQEDMSYYVSAVEQAAVDRHTELFYSLVAIDAWRNPEHYDSIEAACADWKDLFGLLSEKERMRVETKHIQSLCILYETKIKPNKDGAQNVET